MLSDDDVYRHLIELAIRYVSFRPRSEKEIRIYLQEKIVKLDTESPLVLEKVIERLRELAYVDDEKFADWWIDQRTAHRQKGALFIAHELAQKGVQREIYEEKLASGNELEKARAIIAKKATQLEQLPFMVQKKKIYSMLGTRGFSGEIIGRVIDEIAKFGYNAES